MLYVSDRSGGFDRYDTCNGLLSTQVFSLFHCILHRRVYIDFLLLRIPYGLLSPYHKRGLGSIWKKAVLRPMVLAIFGTWRIIFFI